MIIPSGIKKNSPQYNTYLEGMYAILRELNTIPYLYELQLRCELFESSGKQELLEKYADAKIYKDLASDVKVSMPKKYVKIATFHIFLI